jgi:tetratricopeptide (TPR) repeat protein
MENGPKAQGEGSSRSGLLGSLDTWQRYLVAIVALLTVVAQLWSILEDRWLLALVTLAIVVVLVGLYALSHRFVGAHPKSTRVLRITIVGVAVALQVSALVLLFFYSYFPRLEERGTTRIAVAMFDGPPLPDPYKECRPSDMLVHTLSRVGDRYGGITAFELPYSVDPDNRLAHNWAQLHGWFDAADVIVYGGYTLYNSAKNVNGKPDEIIINPEVITVPLIPIGYKSAPLYSWTFAATVARIDDLCGGDLRAAGTPPAFLDDARRGAAALAGLQSLGKGNLQRAFDAQIEAQRPEVSAPQPCEGDATTGASKNSYCPGDLAFYLATLDARLGSLQRAAREYQYAAARLGATEAYLDLGELYARLGNSNASFRAFDAAVGSDPSSVAALATRAEYERDALRPHASALDLERAVDIQTRIDAGQTARPAGNLYDRLALSRAFFDRAGDGGASCGLRAMQSALFPRGVNGSANSNVGPEASVEYAINLKATDPAEAMRLLRGALDQYPDSVHANYVLGLALEQSVPPNRDGGAYYLRRAEHAPAITDDDYLYRANAAYELAAHIDTDAGERRYDQSRAFSAYAQSLVENPFAVYALYGRAQMERAAQPSKAVADLQAAVKMHPNDALLQSSLAQLLDSLGRASEGKMHHDAAANIARERIPSDERGWSSTTCSYASPSP